LSGHGLIGASWAQYYKSGLIVSLELEIVIQILSDTDCKLYEKYKICCIAFDFSLNIVNFMLEIFPLKC